MRGSHFYSAFLLDFSPHGGIWQNKNNGAKWGGRQRMFSIVPSILMAFLFPYNYYAFAYPSILIQLIIPFRLLSSSAVHWQRFIFVVKTEYMPRVEFAGCCSFARVDRIAWFPTIPFQNEITTPIFSLFCHQLSSPKILFFGSIFGPAFMRGFAFAIFGVISISSWRMTKWNKQKQNKQQTTNSHIPNLVWRAEFPFQSSDRNGITLAPP